MFIVPNDYEVLNRFWAKIHKTDSCWLWTAGKKIDGYGKFKIHGQCVLAHRVSYAIHYGSFPKSNLILHSCDNPSCVNPAHLRIGTQSDNISEAWSKGRMTGNLKQQLYFKRMQQL